MVRDPNEAYTRAVKEALVDAMLESSGPLNLAPDEWLTVAARDNVPQRPAGAGRLDRAQERDLQDQGERSGRVPLGRDDARTGAEEESRPKEKRLRPGNRLWGTGVLLTAMSYNAAMRSRLLPAGFALCLVLVLLVTAGCARTRYVENDLKLVDVKTGWYDAGIVGGQNKIVPSITLKLQNVSDESISRVQVWAVFRRANEDKTWGEHFVRAIGPEGLDSGKVGDALVLRSTLGYTELAVAGADAAEPRVRRRQGERVRQARLAHVDQDGRVHRRSPPARAGE